MDKKVGQESNLTFLLNTLGNFINNISISIDKTEHITAECDKASRDLIKPITKTKNCLFTNIKTIIDKFKSIHDRFQSKATFISEFVKTSDQPLSYNLIKEECILNNSVTLEQPKLVNQIEKANKATCLLNKLKESKDFLDLIDLMKEDEEEATESIAVSKDMDNNSDNENNTESQLKKKRNRSVSKSHIELPQESRIKPKKISKSITAQPKKPFTSKELLLKIKRKFSGSLYAKKLTKTFIKRRLNRTVIYEHIFEYAGDKVIDNRIKTIGEKASYRYCKFIFDFAVPNAINDENVVVYMRNLFKRHYFIEKQSDKLIFAGKLNDNLLTLIDSCFKTTILKDKFSISKVVVYSFEFFEELVHEFDISNVKVKSFFDDQSMNKLMDNWKMLEKIREYVSKQQEKGK